MLRWRDRAAHTSARSHFLARERVFLGGGRLVQVQSKSENRIGGNPKTARRIFMNSEQPASWRAFTKPPPRRSQPRRSLRSSTSTRDKRLDRYGQIWLIST